MKSDEDALRNSLALWSAGVTRLPAMTLRTTEPFDLTHGHAPFMESSRRSRATGRRVGQASQDRDDRGRDLFGPGVGLLRRRAHGTIGFERWDSDGGVAARQRRSGPGGPRGERLLLVDGSEQGRSAAEGAAQAVRCGRGETNSDSADPVQPPPDQALSTAGHRAGDPSSASGRGRVAPDVRGRRLAPAGADHELPPRAGLSAAGRGCCLDRPHAHERDVVPGHLGARGDDALPRAGGRSDDAALRPRRDVQQRIQAKGLRGRVRL